MYPSLQGTLHIGGHSMFCNFDCASLLKLLCGFFGKC
nr:MAG TPA_asm: hypothetical protein [Caudoviricetes sp.]